MAKSNYKKANATYDATTKTLLIDQTRKEFVPSYAYYVCEYEEQKHNIEIVNVVFIQDESRAYRKEELKGKYGWDEIDEQDRNATSNC